MSINASKLQLYKNVIMAVGSGKYIYSKKILLPAASDQRPAAD